MVADSTEDFSDLFPGMKPVPMNQLIGAYIDCVEGSGTGVIVRAYA